MLKRQRFGAKITTKTVRFPQKKSCEIHYRPEPKTLGTCLWQEKLKEYRIISFTDAGFASLEGDCSIESNVVIFGKILFRDGVIHCHGYLLDHRCAKIQRVCRSSLSAECHAAVTAGDYSLWYQILLNELFTHRLLIRQLCPPTNYPMLDPFSKSPSDATLKAEKLYLSKMEAQWDPTYHLEGESKLWNTRKCESCQVCFPICTQEGKYQPGSSLTLESPLFKPLLLTDCCSLFSSILKMQPNANERCSRIILAHLRDLQALITISFVDASVNIGDSGTKHGGNTTLLYDFLSTGRFTISFVGRKELSQAKKG